MTGKQSYIIAEMACSHEGDPRLARLIIDGAGAAGAEAIQFQIWSLPHLVVPHHPDYPKLQQVEIPSEDWQALEKYVRERYPGMHIVACVSEKQSVELAERLEVDAFKLHAADLCNPQLIRYVAATGKRIDLSVGASTLDEIAAAVECIREESASEIWLMYGFQNFPTRVEDIRLGYMKKLQDLFELPVGYQDHSDAGTDASFWLPAAALGMGIRILEKHITHDRAQKGVDHEAALNPDEFARFVTMVRQIEAAAGAAVPGNFSPAELKYRRQVRKSIVAAGPIHAGARITEENLAFLRAEEVGFPPDQIKELLGRTAKHEIPANTVITRDDVV